MTLIYSGKIDTEILFLKQNLIALQNELALT